MPQYLHHRPIWPSPVVPTTTIHTNASLQAYGATIAQVVAEAGAPGHYEISGFWQNSNKQIAHITLMELSTFRLALRKLIEMCALRRSPIIHVYTDNQVVMYAMNDMVSKYPALKTDLRRLHDLLKRSSIELKARFLPSALNLFADGLSRRMRSLDYLPIIPSVNDHWWAGESEHDLKVDCEPA